MTPLKNNSLFLLAIITLFAAITRIWFFWKDGLHVDEKFTLELVQNSTVYIIKYSLTNDCNPPLFYLIDGFSVWLLGATRFAERLPSVIAGIVLVPVSYYFGKELKSNTLGLFTALGVATLGPLWYYSQFGRAYMLECLVFAVFCIYYVRLVCGQATNTNWGMVTGTAIILAWLHLYAIIPISFLFLYLIYQYRLSSIKWMVLTFILSSPLLLLFNAILKDRAVSRQIASTSWNWYGATVPQIIIFAPLEYFGYSFVFWVPMILYATWNNREMREVVLFSGVFLISFTGLLLLADTTPVFIRYLFLFVPILISIGLLPVAEFVDNPDYNKAQKWFVIGSFSVFYFAIIFYAFWSGLYPEKGTYFV